MSWDLFRGGELAFWYMGLSNMVPYNVMITAVDFFDDHYGGDIEYYIAVALVLPNLLGLVVNASGVLDNVTSESLRVVGSTLVMTMICVVVPFLYRISESEALLLVATGLIGFFSAVAQSTLYALTGRCAPEHTAAISSGGGMGGVIVCILRIVTKAATPSVQIAADIYFAISCAVLLLSVPVFLHTIHSSEVVMDFLRRSSQPPPPAPATPIQGSDRTPPPPRPAAAAVSMDMASDVQGAASPQISYPKPFVAPQRARALVSGGGLEESLLPTHGTPMADRRALTRVLSNWEVATTHTVPYLMAAVFANYMVTLSVFPGLTTQLTAGKAISKSWLSVVLITLFNTCDFIGKSLPLRPSFKRCFRFSPAGLLWIALARIGFVPLFLLAYYGYVTWEPMIAVMICFGISNGILGSLTMMAAPSKVDDMSKGKAGSMMVFMLGLGLACGSFTGVGIMQVLKHA